MIMCYLCDSFKIKKKESGQVLGVCEGPNLLPIMFKVGVPHVYLESGPSPVLLSTMVVRPAEDPGWERWLATRATCQLELWDMDPGSSSVSTTASGREGAQCSRSAPKTALTWDRSLQLLEGPELPWEFFCLPGDPLKIGVGSRKYTYTMGQQLHS